MTKMAVLREVGAPLEILDLDLPEVGPTDVRVRIAAAGVCHSDLSYINGTVASQLPVVLGHEASGYVSEVGSDVEGLSEGQPVVLNWAPPCRECWFCQNDEPWLCSAVEKAGTSAPYTTMDGGSTLHKALGVGAFAEEVVLPANAVVPIPDGIDMAHAALLGCAVLTGVGAAINTAGVQEGQSVLVLGLGGIGLSVVTGARLAGASQIIAADVSEAKRDFAMQMGATDFVLSSDSLHKDVRGLTDGRGVDHAFECVGRSITMKAAYKSTRRGGACTVVGVGRKDDELSLNAMEIFHFNRSLRSSVFGSSDPAKDIPSMVTKMSDGDLDLESMISHRIRLDELIAGFERMGQAEGARSVVVMDD
ncbi:zinc-binding dehydrogenase [Brevibacterium jeotgali]|uniref:S-(Hydroxymethyl)glutathione dehydrogenase / alcohol dehydrogenase n=1 Tax=Brevibacterium jeotgali TaxID=1262550 RepID=A0A2H1L868_9MICO|nr:zinc-binding dehydrogenase [Brevibacterium jeotgali]TWC01625.1 S-(hydroxymethyl)glutathione dehydrogenase/alcohol dehydrogenase [Brevibacterium jeotgali]SMY13062.1 S-(hydroxymethyl)glutathione dehydrogenase / alcohol dehydrogenase [Brevibacterium jeotgali]